MSVLTTTQKAKILDNEGAVISAPSYSAASSDPAIVGIGDNYGVALYAVGVSAGTATVTATRLSDGSTADLEVTVVAADPFSISLAAPEPK